MTESVGGISASFTGDSSGLAKAVNDALVKLDAARAKSAELASALKDTSVTSRLSADGLKALQSMADKAEGEIRQLTAASKEQAIATSRAVETSSNGMAKAREGIEKVRGAMGAVGQLAGVATGQFGALGGVIQNALGAFMTGGGLGLGITAITSAIAVAADKWDLFGKKAAEAAEKTKSALDKLDGEILDIKYEIIAMATGDDINVIKQRAAVEAARGNVSSAVEAAGGEQSVRQTAVLHQRGRENPLAGMEEAYAKAEQAQIVLTAEQDKLSEMMKRADLAKEIASQAQLIDKANQEEQKYQDALKHASEELAKTSPEARASAAIDAVSGVVGSITGTGDVNDKLSAAMAKPMSQDEASGLVGLGSAAEETQASLEDVNASLARAWAAEDKLAASHQQLEDVMFQSAQSVQDLSDPLSMLKGSIYSLADGLETAIDSITMGDVAGAVKTAATSGFQGAGAGVGAQIGAMVTTALGGADGGLGTIIGGILGGILGKALDELIKVLEVTTPLFDAIAVVIQSLEPILLVLRQLFMDVGRTIITLAPLILILSKVVAALMIPFLRVIEVLLPLVGIVVIAATALVMFIDIITLGVKFLDDHFFRPLVQGVAWVFNSFVDIVNMITAWMRVITGNDKFGAMIEHMDAAYAPLISKFGDRFEPPVVPPGAESPPDDGNGGSGSGGSGSGGGLDMTNVPNGYKRRLDELMFSGADATGSASASSNLANGQINLVISNWNSRGTATEDLRELTRLAKSGHTVPIAARNFNPDDKN